MAEVIDKRAWGWELASDAIERRKDEALAGKQYSTGTVWIEVEVPGRLEDEIMAAVNTILDRDKA